MFKILLSLFLIFSFSSQADIFTISDIKVDVTDKNATIAKNKAMKNAQNTAFTKLLNRITLLPNGKEMPVLTEDEIVNLVQDLSVSDEKTSSVRYMASVNVRFNANEVQNLLQQNELPYITKTAELSILLPIMRYRLDEQGLLWEDENIWLKAFQNQNNHSDLVPIVIPKADDEDKLYFKSENIHREYDVDTMPLLLKYNAKQILVAEALVNLSLGQVKVFVRPFNFEKSSIDNFFVTELIDAPLDEVLNRAAQKVVYKLDENWRYKNALRFDAPTNLKVSVPIENLRQWTTIREKLDKISTIKKYVVTSIRKDKAQIEIFFVGQMPVFMQTIEEADLFLSPNTDDTWTLRHLSTVSAEEQRLVHQYLSEQNALLSENADTLPKTPEEILSVLDLTVTAPVSSFAPFSTNSTSDLGEDETFDIFEEDASFAIQPFETEGFINE